MCVFGSFSEHILPVNNVLVWNGNLLIMGQTCSSVCWERWICQECWKKNPQFSRTSCPVADLNGGVCGKSSERPRWRERERVCVVDLGGVSAFCAWVTRSGRRDGDECPSPTLQRAVSGPTSERPISICSKKQSLTTKANYVTWITHWKDCAALPGLTMS